MRLRRWVSVCSCVVSIKLMWYRHCAHVGLCESEFGSTLHGGTPSTLHGGDRISALHTGARVTFTAGSVVGARTDSDRRRARAARAPAPPALILDFAMAVKTCLYCDCMFQTQKGVMHRTQM